MLMQDYYVEPRADAVLMCQRDADLGQHEHVIDFAKQHNAIKNHFGVSDADFTAYQKSILDDALVRESQAENRQQSQTNARIAKQKRRGLLPQSSQTKLPGPRPSAKQRRTQATKRKD